MRIFPSEEECERQRNAIDEFWRVFFAETHLDRLFDWVLRWLDKAGGFLRWR